MQVINDLYQKAHGTESYKKKKIVKNGSDRTDADQQHSVFCICSSCGERVLRSQGTFCYQQICPICSVTMVRDWRQESYQ